MTAEIFSSMPITGAAGASNAGPRRTLTVNDALYSREIQPYDSFEMQGNAPKPGFIAGIKRHIAGAKKFFARTAEYTKGFFGGLFDGAVYGSVIYTGSNLINFFKKSSKLPSKFLAIGAAAAAMGLNLWNASLNATQRESEIDHRWIGHNPQN